MKPKIKRLLIAIGGLLLGTNAFAHNFEVDGIYYNIKSSTGKTVEVTYRGNSYSSYNNEYTGSIVIPSTVTYYSTTYSVTSIGDEAFRSCSDLSSVTIPNSVTSIGEAAFSGCTGLTEVNITDLSAWCKIDFYDWSSNPLSYARHLKLNDKEITNLVIPDGITEIKDYAFEGCSGLTSVTIPNSVTSISDYAFYGCTGLMSVTIGNSVSSIGESAFYGCTGLTSVTIPNSVSSIGDYAFAYCRELAEFIIADGTKAISLGNLFRECSLTKLYLGRNLSYNTNSSPFSNISTLNEVTIGNSVTSIGESAFKGCTGLILLNIGNSVTSIGNSAFYGCSNLIIVINHSNLPLYEGSTDYGYVAYYATTVINDPNAIIDEDFVWSKLEENNVNSLVAYLGSASELILPDDYNGGNYVIGDYAFSGCSSLMSVEIGNSVTSIGSGAFAYCSGLTEVTIGNSVASIGDEAFYECSGLTKVNYNAENCTSMGSGYFPVFKDCTNLKTLNIGNSVKRIPNYMFYGCSSLTSVTIGNSVTAIETYAFEGCTGLTEVNITDLSAWCKIDFWSKVANPLYYAHHLKLNGKEITDLVIPDGITKIGFVAFWGCSGLRSVTFPNSVTEIGSSAFQGCSELTSITIPNSVTEIGSHAFYETGWYNNQPDGILYLENCCLGYKGDRPTGNLSLKEGTRLICEAFPGCTGLTSITIPNSVTSIGSYAFNYCTGLTSITIPDSVTEIGSCAFSFCHGLTSVLIGNSVTSIGYYAFYDCSGLTKLYSKAIVPPTCSEDVFYNIDKWNCELYVPQASIADYQTADQWKEFVYIKDIESGVEEVLVDGVDYSNSQIEIYNLSGLKVGDSTENLAPGVYIKRQGGKVEKFSIQ